jgi:hypothetical protein
MKISCDSQSAIFLEKNLSYHSKTKHIVVQCHFVRDVVERNKVLLEKVDTFENITNSLINSLSAMNFSWCTEAMGIACPRSVKRSSEISWFQKRRQQVGECWFVILFAVKFKG